MIELTIAFALGGFALGSYLAYRYAPPLARARGSTAVGVVICMLVGAAVGLAFMDVYLGVYALIHEPPLRGLLGDNGAGTPTASPDANIFVGTVYSIASESGVLLALAAGVYLLGSARASDPTSVSSATSARGARTGMD